MRFHAIRPPLFCAVVTASLVVGCASTKESKAPPSSEPEAQPAAATVAPGPMSDEAKAIVAAEDRTEDDRKNDARRHPAELLTFLGISPGMKVADLGAGGGYTTELLARAVGPDGVVFAQNNAGTIEKYVSESWPKRLARPVNAAVVRVDREFPSPLPDAAIDLDAVTIIFSYHDVVAHDDDRGAMNAAVFAALKPGGIYVVADHNAPEDSDLSAANALHRLRAKFVREEVEAAGFAFVEDAAFLRDPTDTLVDASYKIGFKTDRYILKFKKPAE